MAIPFGFSIGDFFVVGQLVQKACRYASASAGLRSEVQTLSNQYGELLLLVDVAASHIARNPEISASIRNSLELHVKRCRDHLESFEHKANPIFDGKGIWGVFQRIQLMPGSVSMFKKLNSHFEYELLAIRLCLDAATQEQQWSSQLSQRDLAKVCQTMSAQLAVMISMTTAMPKIIGFPWEGGDLKRHITMVHATGETWLVPFDFWLTFERLHKFLTITSDYPGYGRMMRNHYRLTDCSTGTTIDAADTERWQQLAQPGNRVIISIAIGTLQKYRATGKMCPKCFSENVPDAMFSGWKKCVGCKLEFQIQKIESWPHRTEPVDFCDMGPIDSPGETSSPAAPFSEQEQPSSISSDSNTPDDFSSRDLDPRKDREEALKHITVVYAPMFNFVFRSAGCMCRLFGDSTPFGPDLDVVTECPCRLHYNPKTPEEIGWKLQYPAKGYDPSQDPYFDRFGGQDVFAWYISGNKLIQSSLKWLHMLPPKAAWHETEQRFKAAQRDEGQHNAMSGWTRYYHDWHDKLKGRYTPMGPEEMQMLFAYNIRKLPRTGSPPQDSASRSRRVSFT